MIEATWVGGPHDGSIMVLPSEDPFFLVMAPAFAYIEYDDVMMGEVTLPVMKARVTPILTDRGWRLYYAEILHNPDCECDCHADPDIGG